MNSRQLKKQFLRIKKTRKNFINHKCTTYLNFTPQSLSYYLHKYNTFTGNYIHDVIDSMKGDSGNITYISEGDKE